MVEVAVHRKFLAPAAWLALVRFGGHFQACCWRPRAMAILVCSFLFLSHLVYNGRSDEVYYGKNFKIQAKNAQPTELRTHEHIVDCSNQSLDDPGVDVHVHNPRIAPGFKMNVHGGSDTVSSSVRTLGCFECGILKDFMQFLASAPPDTFVLDIGGNIGLYSLNAAALGRDVFTFEPLRQNWQRLCRSVRINPGYEQRITLFNVAVTEASRVMEFQNANTLKKNYGGTQVHEVSQKSLTGSAVKGVDYVPGVPLGLLQEILPSDRPVVVKIDVEGCECDALAGALEYLQTLDILYVQIEWSPKRLQDCNQREAIFELFRIKRLTPYLYNDSPLSNTRKRADPKKWEHWRFQWLFAGFYDEHYFDIVWIRE